MPDPSAQGRRRIPLVVLLLPVGFSVALFAYPGWFKPAPPKPSAAREGEAWAHRELFDYLKARRVVCESEPFAVAFVSGPAERFYAPDGRYVVAHRLPTAEAARAERQAIGGGPDDLTWGRFRIFGESGLVAEVRAALAD